MQAPPAELSPIQAELKELREVSGLTQGAWAGVIDVSVATVNRWERGKADPSMLLLERARVGLAKEAGMHPEEIEFYRR